MSYACVLNSQLELELLSCKFEGTAPMPDEIDNTLPTDPPENPTEPPSGGTDPGPGGGGDLGPGDPGEGGPGDGGETAPPTGEQAPGEEAKYHPPEPPDVYQQAPVQFTDPGTTADFETGLPANPREPYPVGDGPVDAGKIKGVS